MDTKEQNLWEEIKLKLVKDIKKDVKKEIEKEKQEDEHENAFLSAINPFRDTKDTVATSLKLFTSALTLVASLAWNEAIKAVIDATLKRWFPEGGGLVGTLIYAAVITVIAVYVINRVKKLEKGVGGKAIK